MEHNSQTIVRELVEEQHQIEASSLSINSYFERYVASLCLRDKSLTAEEIEHGIVGGSNDGGIDGFYVFVNDSLYAEDMNFAAFGDEPRIAVYIIQAKYEKKFLEETLNKLEAVSRDLLSLNANSSKFDDVYNEDILRAFDQFRQVYRKLLRKSPVLEFHYLYATVRAPKPITSGLENKKSNLKKAVKERFSDAAVSIQLLGADELWSLNLRKPSQTRSLETIRSSSGREGYISLVSLNALNAFLRDEDGAVDQAIFDENVRDWQGNTSVNLNIESELEDGAGRDFWWLNNGVTVLCQQYRNDDNIVTLTNPQIVNGLQTCRHVTNFYGSRSAIDGESRSVLVKIIRVENEDTRDEIIRATNSQNSVSVAMLRATDPFQRKLEKYLYARELFYERRRNYYKNRGKALARLVSLTFVAQSVLALHRFEPNTARARPSNPLKSDAEYEELFSDQVPLDAYYKAIALCKSVETILKQDVGLSAKEVNNLRFYVALVVAQRELGKFQYGRSEIAKIDLNKISRKKVVSAHQFVWKSYKKHGADDDAVRGSSLVKSLTNRMKRELSS